MKYLFAEHLKIEFLLLGIGKQEASKFIVLQIKICNFIT